MPDVLSEPVAYPAQRASGCPFDPPPAYRVLQDEAPITRVACGTAARPGW